MSSGKPRKTSNRSIQRKRSTFESGFAGVAVSKKKDLQLHPWRANYLRKTDHEGAREKKKIDARGTLIKEK